MPDSKTIIVGDEIANGIDKALRALPDTLPLWTVALPGWPILPYAAEQAIDKIKTIEAEWRKRGGDPSLPTRIIVSGGRVEALEEPADLSDKELAQLAADVKTVADKLKEVGEVIWLLPPAITGERKARSVIEKALRDDGVRVLDASQFVADPKASRDKPAPADLPDDAYNAMAKKLKTWVPIGPSPFSNMVLTPPSATESALDKAKSKLSAAVAAVSSWSRPTQIASGAAVAAIVFGGIYAASRPRKKDREP